jgi:hypothetical protein
VVTDRWRRRTILGLLTAGACLLVLTAIGMWSSRSGGLLVLARLFDRPFLFGSLVLGTLIAAVMVGSRSLGIRIVAGTLAVFLGFLAVPLYSLSGDDPKVTMDQAAPERPDRHLVVEMGSVMIDTLWWVHVDEGSGLTKRRWQVGYFNGDAGDNALVEAVWAGPNRIRLTIGDEQVHLIDVSPAGRPLRTLSLG